MGMQQPSHKTVNTGKLSFFVNSLHNIHDTLKKKNNAKYVKTIDTNVTYCMVPRVTTGRPVSSLILTKLKYFLTFATPNI